MNLQDIHDAYTRLRQLDSLHDLVAGSKNSDDTSRLLPAMSLSNLAFDVVADNVSPNDALDTLQAFAPLDGWLTFQSAHRIILNGDYDSKSCGALLCGESVNKDGETLAITSARSGLKLTRYSPTQGSDYLTDTVTHLGVSKAPGNLRYRRYWRLDSEASCRVEPFAACFTGFAATEGKNSDG